MKFADLSGGTKFPTTKDSDDELYFQRQGGVCFETEFTKKQLEQKGAYIDSTPEENCFPRDHDKDEFIIVASDGLWEYLTPEQATKQVADDFAQGVEVEDAADNLLEVLKQAAAKHYRTKNITVPDLEAMVKAGQGRSILDDTTLYIMRLRQSG
eukprot:GHVQ01003974.1.p1 GENE.GHVQ01003974.1~~GHVQ01003974.1.p1  ORF type:complete len:154 (+),score=23.49 GHVQ01003974.1:460-921(+)